MDSRSEYRSSVHIGRSDLQYRSSVLISILLRYACGGDIAGAETDCITAAMSAPRGKDLKEGLELTVRRREEQKGGGGQQQARERSAHERTARERRPPFLAQHSPFQLRVLVTHQSRLFCALQTRASA